MSWNMYVYVWVIELECRCVSVCVWYVGMLYILVHWNVYVCVCTNFPKCKWTVRNAFKYSFIQPEAMWSTPFALLLITWSNSQAEMGRRAQTSISVLTHPKLLSAKFINCSFLIAHTALSSVTVITPLFLRVYIILSLLACEILKAGKVCHLSLLSPEPNLLRNIVGSQLMFVE